MYCSIVVSDYNNKIIYKKISLFSIAMSHLQYNFRGILLPISITYVTGGLALATVAIRVLGVYLNKLHNFGKKLKKTGSRKIWFGGRT